MGWSVGGGGSVGTSVLITSVGAMVGRIVGTMDVGTGVEVGAVVGVERGGTPVEVGIVDVAVGLLFGSSEA